MQAEADYLNVMKRVAVEAGKIAMEGFRKCSSYDTKDGPADLVTEYDRRCEAHIRAHLPVLDYFYGEESSDGTGLPRSGSGWVVDPIDGTTNFVHGVQFFAISIALVREGLSLIGVIYAPALDTLYYAISGKGAFISKASGPAEPLVIKNKESTILKTSLVSCEFGATRGDPQKIERGLCELGKLLKLPVHGIRQFGAATMNILNVAIGVVDVYYERGLKPWDMAAAVVIAREAGGTVTGITNAKFELDVAEAIFAANPRVADELRALIK